MRRSQRFISAAVLIALSGALSGCGSMGNWDPSDLLDFLDTKKKLPGERKPVFPEGVPGLEQGVPKSLYRGSAQEQIDQQNAAAAAAANEPPPPEPKSKRASRSKPKANSPVAANPAPAAEPAPGAEAPPEEEGSTAAAPPAPKPVKQSRRRITTPPPDQPAAAPAQQQSNSAFPAPLPGGSFSR
jgi:hypothetical protein